ncbi:uncharacterized protein LOC127104997 isoform X1 [Lathyrus oleraceus]|uniref:uncharacterized protein LOC127104997 isoform X1 n=1 Tax=Pisum sativum TaxID=3888 RepID=UPI0021CE9F3F|nr:uncharacterized protein LOC127104997 isoform X1 [Pisum sativum]
MMDLIGFLILCLCITCCKIDARNNIQKIQHHNQMEDDFDCVDIYKQPSLQHPLLKNHKIQDRTTGHWWLIIQNEPIYTGYWPKELFTHLRKGASLIRFGGQTYAPPNKDSPPMGSGRLPKEKFRNSGFMGLLKIIDSEYNENNIKPEDMKRYSNTKIECYDMLYRGYEGSVYKQAFLYGGPGGRSCDI